MKCQQRARMIFGHCDRKAWKFWIYHLCGLRSVNVGGLKSAMLIMLHVGV